MQSGKEILEKIWWVIPLIVNVFIYMPILFIVINSIWTCFPNQDTFLSSLFSDYIRVISCLFGNVFCIISTTSMIGITSFVCYLNRKKPLSSRIFVPIVIGIVGFSLGFFILLGVIYYWDLYFD